MSGPGSISGRGHHVVFLDKTLYSHSASHYPGVKLGTGELNVHLHLVKSFKIVGYHSNSKNLNKNNTNLLLTERDGRTGEY